MKKMFIDVNTFSVLSAIFLCVLTLISCAKQQKTVVFFDAAKGDDVTAQGVTTELRNGELYVTTVADYNSPGIVLKGDWSLYESNMMLLELTNHDDRPLTLRCRLESPRTADDMRNFVQNNVTLAPGETRQYRYNLPMKMPEVLKDKFTSMNGNPFDNRADRNSVFDPQNISKVTLFTDQSGVSRWSVKLIAAMPVEALNLSHVEPANFFPMIDKYGQFMHRDWPGKIHEDSDLQKSFDAEIADLAAHPTPKDRNKYGGWTAGPKREATGHFRTEKIDGKWWIIDPEGCLFWSHGVDCVIDLFGATPINDLEYLFTELPPDDGPFASCYGWRGDNRTYDFLTANIIRKYGENWTATYYDFVHQRLHSWGMNTIGNWSTPAICRMQRTPYTDNLSVNAPSIRGNEGRGRFPDPFDTQFRQSIKASAASAAQSSGDDPWCLGYFVSNELGWGNETSLSLIALASPPEQPAKIALVEHLKNKYDGDITKLNNVWQSEFKNWEALLQATERPNEQNAREDLVECYRLIAECYFSVISEEVKTACPDKLYLGCRFSSYNPVVATEAAKYCDIVSYNIYRYDLNHFTLPEGVDKPCIIGEFHFGALDRGMLHAGLCPTESQEARAAAYEKYVKSALNNPYYVGTHWFQYMDQATTGRYDGENYQIGIVSLCDSPYPETIATVRKMGDIMYELRYNK